MNNAKPLVTLAVDIGGTGLKMLCLDHEGKALTERLRVPTPEPATPSRLLAALDKLRAQMPEFDRVSVGYPGVIKRGVVLSAANLHPRWIGFPLQTAAGEAMEEAGARGQRCGGTGVWRDPGTRRGDDYHAGHGDGFGAVHRRAALSGAGAGTSSVAKKNL